MLKSITSSLFIFLFFAATIHAQSTIPSAENVIHAAIQRAGQEHKKVFIIFHASWCGWCHRMDSLMNSEACKALFDKNYVIEHLTVMESEGKKGLENPGASDLLKKLHGGDSIPFWVVFDEKGNPLADCLMKPEDAKPDVTGDNIGCPSTKDEVAYFVKVLKKTSSLNAGQLAVIEKAFWMK
jgi:thioredoxin-related protein